MVVMVAWENWSLIKIAMAVNPDLRLQTLSWQLQTFRGIIVGDWSTCLGRRKKASQLDFGLCQRPFGPTFQLQLCHKGRHIPTSSSCVSTRSPWSSTTCRLTSTSWSPPRWRCTSWPANNLMCVGKFLFKAVLGHRTCPMDTLLGIWKLGNENCGEKV